MNIYGKAMTDTKRQPNRKVVEMVLKSSKTEEGNGKRIGPIMDFQTLRDRCGARARPRLTLRLRAVLADRRCLALKGEEVIH
jgi:hypothetical protein